MLQLRVLGNLTIHHLPHDVLRNRYLCIDHFDDKYISKSGKTSVRRRITKQAVPCHYKKSLDITSHSPSPSTSQGKVYQHCN